MQRLEVETQANQPQLHSDMQMVSPTDDVRMQAARLRLRGRDIWRVMVAASQRRNWES